MVTALQHVRRHPAVPVLLRTTTTLALLTVGYFMLPVTLDWGRPRLYLQLLVSVLALVGLYVVLRQRVRDSLRRREQPYARVEWLLAALYLIILSFAVVYAVLGVHAPDQFVGIADRMDALYFSVTLMSTVGFGDVSAQGTLGRAVVTVHMLFNLIYLGTGIKLLSGDRSLGATPGPDGH